MEDPERAIEIVTKLARVGDWSSVEGVARRSEPERRRAHPRSASIHLQVTAPTKRSFCYAGIAEAPKHNKDRKDEKQSAVLVSESILKCKLAIQIICSRPDLVMSQVVDLNSISTIFVST
jgi:hypothetical protein